MTPRCPECGAPPCCFHDEDCALALLRHREAMADPNAHLSMQDVVYGRLPVTPREYLTAAYETGLR